MILAMMLAAPVPAATTAPPAAAIADPPIDEAHPASMAAFVIPAQGGAMNAVIYVAAGLGPHPTLLLLHGFPGNEQNLDLAQAARRAGWNVLTLHYRGSWGSPGSFSYAHCAEDADTALAWLRSPDAIARYAIDPARIAVAGHSMGGMMAARAVADDPKVVGLFLIDPWDIAHEGEGFRADPKARERFLASELRDDLPPLAGTSEAALVAEIEQAGPRLDLARTLQAIGPRPTTMIYTERGIGAAEERRVASAAGRPLIAELWPTDHSFSDMRIALAVRLVDWLGRFTAR
jgi:pimeloyl-ACP methyl ester carboxylesterase